MLSVKLVIWCVKDVHRNGNLTLVLWGEYTGHECEALVLSLLLTWTNCWTNSRVTGDFRGHETHVTSKCVFQTDTSRGWNPPFLCQWDRWCISLRWQHGSHIRRGTVHSRSLLPRHFHHYGDVIMGAIASQITSLTIVYSTVYSDADQRKHQSSASLAFARGIHRGPVNSNAENVSIWWRHHDTIASRLGFTFAIVELCAMSCDIAQLYIASRL